MEAKEVRPALVMVVPDLGATDALERPVRPPRGTLRLILARRS
jgi:hypothetical protein